MKKIMSKLAEIAKDISVLYVEDDEASREEVLLSLEYFFKDIVCAKDGIEGINEFIKKNGMFDLLITDITMPKMNGLDMIKKIRALNPNISIMVFSAHGDNDNLKKIIDLSIDGFLSKPVSNENYFNVLYKVTKNIYNKKELGLYKNRLEQKVKEQLEQIHFKDKMLEKHAKLAAMGEMIDIIAHQWKQPLNIILMRSSFLKELSEGSACVSFDDIVECSLSVSKQVSHLVSTLDEFRNFFRPIDDYESIDLGELFKSLELLLHDDLVKNQIVLEKNLDYTLCYGNLNECKHIFINLINNARDAFNQNSITNRKIVISTQKKGNFLEISLTDNGGGISKEIQQKIFEPNFTTKKDMGGTGIGLYICRTIIQKHHGEIKVVSQNGLTTFILSLPVTDMF